MRMTSQGLAPADSHTHGGSFRHEALLYAGEPQFVAATTDFIREGLTAGEPVLAVVEARKIQLLRSALGADADRVDFADMAVVGHNPGRILDAWYRFAADHAAAGRGARGIGEPVYASRSAAELVECQLHEALLNVAFPAQPPWTLLCPYDTSTLGVEELAEARRSHPFVRQGTETAASVDYRHDGADPWHLRAPLPDPPAAGTDELAIDHARLARARHLVAARAVEAGASMAHAGELSLAISELATNSLRHGGGWGRLRLWHDADAGMLVCEVSDGGHITDPLVGRRRPTGNQLDGRGLWLVNQLCDLVQLRTSPEGTVVRVHMRVT